MMTSKYIAHFLEQVSSWQQKLSVTDQVWLCYFLFSIYHNLNHPHYPFVAFSILCGPWCIKLDVLSFFFFYSTWLSFPKCLFCSLFLSLSFFLTWIFVVFTRFSSRYICSVCLRQHFVSEADRCQVFVKVNQTFCWVAVFFITPFTTI